MAHSKKTRDSGEKRQFCTFWVAGRLYGVDILAVKEINPEKSFTSIYHAPPEIKGYVNIRGQIHLVIDLRRLLGFGETAITPKSLVVLFKEEVGESFGVLVDRIGDVIAVNAGEIEERRREDRGAPETGERRAGSGQLTTGVCKLEGTLLVILDARQLLPAVERVAVAAD